MLSLCGSCEGDSADSLFLAASMKAFRIPDHHNATLVLVLRWGPLLRLSVRTEHAVIVETLGIGRALC